MSDLSIEVLRRVRPEAVRVVQSDGRERVLTPQRHHRKWMRVTEEVEQLDWQRVELVRGGEVARVIEAPEQAAPPAPAAPVAEVPGASHLSPEAAAMVAGQALVLQMVQNSQAPLLDALVKMAESSTKRLASLEASLARTHDLLQETLTDAVAARMDAAEAEAEAAKAASEDSSNDALKELAAAIAMSKMNGGAKADA